MPRETFERKLQDPLVRPSTAGLINGSKPKNEPQQAPDDALALWGWLKDFEKNVDYCEDVNVIVGKLSHAVQSDVRRIAPLVTDWLGELKD
jgi:hypothetical protein